MGTRTNGCPGGCGVRSGGFADRRLHPGVGLVSRKLGASCSQRGQLFGTGSANRCHAERTIQAARHGKPFGLRGVDTGGADDSVPGVPGAQERRGVPSESLAAGRFGGVKTLRAFATVAVSNAWRGLVSPPRIMLPSRSKDVHGNPVVTRTKSCGPNPADCWDCRRLERTGNRPQQRLCLPDRSTFRLVASLFLPMRGCFRAGHSDWSGQPTQRS